MGGGGEGVKKSISWRRKEGVEKKMCVLGAGAHKLTTYRVLGESQ